jgi:Uma2 family endonuclease
MNESLLIRPHTPEDLLRMPDGDRYELVDGHLVQRAMGAESSRVAVILIRLLDAHAHTNRLGRVFATDCGYQCFPDHPNRVRYPDCSFVALGRLPGDRPPQGHVHIAPDLAVEVVSPNDVACDVEQRIEDFLRAGVQLLWVVYPNTRRVLVFRPGGHVSRLNETEELTGEDVLPGFRSPLAEVFDAL